MNDEETTQPQNGELLDPTEGQTVEEPMAEAAIEEAPVEETPKEAPPAAATTSLSPEAIAQLAAATAGAVQQAVPQQQQKISPEEYSRIMNVYTPTAEVAKSLGLTEEAVPALAQMLQSVQRQAQTMAALQVEGLRRQFTNQLNPLQVAAQAQNEQALKGEFLKANPEFTGFEPVLDMVYKQMDSEGYKGTKDNAFKEAAKRARGFIEQLPKGGVKAAAPKTRMSTVSAGGQGGAGQGTGGKATQESLARSLFG